MRILAFGSAALMDGFALLGIETHADPDAEQIDDTLGNLVRTRERALVFMQQDLMDADIPSVEHLRLQGGSILIAEIPSLQAAGDYRPQVDNLIKRVLGAAVLEKQLGN